VMYVAPFFAEKIRQLQLGPGERFIICKRAKQNGRSKGIEWEIRRVEPAGRSRRRASGAAAHCRSRVSTRRIHHKERAGPE